MGSDAVRHATITIFTYSVYYGIIGVSRMIPEQPKEHTL